MVAVVLFVSVSIRSHPQKRVWIETRGMCRQVGATKACEVTFKRGCGLKRLKDGDLGLEFPGEATLKRGCGLKPIWVGVDLRVGSGEVTLKRGCGLKQCDLRTICMGTVEAKLPSKEGVD